MPTVDRQNLVQIPDGKTKAQLSMTGTGNKATVNIKDSAGKIIQRFNLDSDSHKTEKAVWSTPPAGQNYVIYNAGPSGINVVWL
jgi:hypothetical protein